MSQLHPNVLAYAAAIEAFNRNDENCYTLRFVDGKVIEGQVFLSDPAHVEEFWA